MNRSAAQFCRGIFILSLMLLCILPSLAAQESKNQLEPMEVVVVFPKNFPPQSFLDNNGQPAGFAIDIMNQVAQLANLKIVYRPVENWTEATNDLLNGHADIIPNSGITPQRLLDSDFTIPVETFDVVLFVRESTHDVLNLNDLKGRKVAVLPANVGKKIVAEQKDIEGVVYNEISTALFDLLAGKVDAFIYPKPVALKLAREAGIEKRIKIVGEPLVEIKRAIRVRKGNKLMDRLNPAVEVFSRSPEYQNIYAKWYGTPQPYWTVARATAVLASIFFIIFFVLILWRYKSLAILNKRLQEEIITREQAEELLQTAHDELEHRVEERTQELAESNKVLVSEILERKKLEESLKGSEEKFRLIADYTYDWDTWISPEGKLLYCSPSCKNISGYDNEEFYHDNELFKKIVHVEDQEVFHDHHQSLLPQVSEACEFEFRIITKSGEMKYLSHICQAVFDDEGNYLGRRGSNRDTTERKALEKTLHRFKNTLDQAHDCVFMFAPDTLRFFYINQGSIKQVGYSEEELYQMTPLDIKPEFTEESFRAMIEPLLNKEKSSLRFKTVHRHKDGTDIPVDVFLQYITATDDETRFVAIVRDISEQKKLEEKLREYGTQQKALLQEVNHRVKNNLTAIISMLHLEEDRNIEQNVRHDKLLLKEIVSRVEGLLIVHSQLSASQWAPLSLSQLCQEIIQGTLRGFFSTHSIQIDVVPSDIYVDADQAHSLALVFNELVTNTVKHGLQGDATGHIIVSMQKKDGRIILIYRDNGPGFPETILEGEIERSCIGVLMITGIIKKSMGGEAKLLNENGAMTTISFAEHC